MKRIFSLLLVAVLLLTLFSCNGKEESAAISGTSASASQSLAESFVPKSDLEMFTERDRRIDYSNETQIKIEFTKSGAVCSSSSVSINGCDAVLLKEGCYVISGECSNGRIVVEADENDKLWIVFDDLELSCNGSAPLYIKSADKVFVTLANGSENTLSAIGNLLSDTDAEIDGAVFSKQDLTLNGNGILHVATEAGKGIVCKDDLVIVGGRYSIVSSLHAIDANDSLRIDGADITLNSGKDGIHVENSADTAKGFVYIANATVDVKAEYDGISASAYLQIEQVEFNITTGGGAENGENKGSDQGFGGGFGGGGRPRRPDGQGGESNGSAVETESKKGIKAGGSIFILQGKYVIDSADDALHSNLSLTLESGEFDIKSGDDGMHADGSLFIKGGIITIWQSYEGLEAQNVVISGGNISLCATDDGINAAGGVDSSGTGGNFGGDRFGGRPGGMGGASSSNGSIVITGGKVKIKASGDGIDANGTLEITGGYVTVCGPTQGDTAVLDYDRSATIAGATFIGTGSSMMAQSLSGEGQGVIAISVGNRSAGCSFAVKDKDGKLLFEYTPELSYQIVIISSPDIVKGNEYLFIIGSESKSFIAK